MSGQTKLDLAFTTFQLNCIVNHSIVDHDLIKANEVLRKPMNENIAIKFGLLWKTETFENAQQWIFT